MARRPRRRPSRSSAGAQAIQIAGLVLILVMILLFRDQISAGAGAFFGSFDSEDVQLPEEQAPDAGHAENSPPARGEETP